MQGLTHHLCVFVQENVSLSPSKRQSLIIDYVDLALDTMPPGRRRVIYRALF